MALKAHIAKPHWIPVVTNLSINFAVLGLVAYFGNTLFLLLARISHEAGRRGR